MKFMSRIFNRHRRDVVAPSRWIIWAVFSHPCLDSKGEACILACTIRRKGQRREDQRRREEEKKRRKEKRRIGREGREKGEEIRESMKRKIKIQTTRQRMKLMTRNEKITGHMKGVRD